MASKKKRVGELDTAEQMSDPSDGENMDEETEMEVNEEIQVDFEARVPEGSDFHGIRTLLQQLFLKANINLSEMADIIISQGQVGSVVKQSYVPEEDDDEEEMAEDDPVLAVTSVINITDKKDMECVKQVRSMLIDQCQKCGGDPKFSKVLNDGDHHVGLLVSERYINIPPQISVPMFDSLLKEVEKCKNKKMKYDFSYYILLCKTYRQKGQKNSPLFFTNAEEEYLQEVSEAKFQYSVQADRDTVVTGTWDSEDQFEAFRTVLLIPADKLKQGVEKIKTELATT
ncbi:protein BCCIP homolog [Saccostrea echinata]|uniref:protein BCCIP homolog n=1 Tax=Saccostrea echinata TaxID=191078 RepID=UPI002A83C1D8|nr:protein BCCIP homolog [Saccostrea echinata]